MNENTIHERKKTDIGTGVQMSKYLQHNSPASQGKNKTKSAKGAYTWSSPVCLSMREGSEYTCFQ